MKRAMMMALLLAMSLCTACAALPAEERAFAVALAVGGQAGEWTLQARIPTYQSGGGYATVTGAGDTLPHAYAALDAASPLQLHAGQLRLIIVAAETASSGDFPQVLSWLADQREMRPGAAVCVTEADAAAVMEAMEPATGTRLSKSLDTLLETRLRQGTVPASVLAGVLTAGVRQSPVLMNLTIENGAVGLGGGWPVGAGGRTGAALTGTEMQLLNLMQGAFRQGTLSLLEGTVRLTGAAAEVELAQAGTAEVRLTLQVAESSLQHDSLRQAVATACLGVLERLSGMGCDALGLGRQAVTRAADPAQWALQGWPGRCREVRWAVTVGVRE